MKKLAGTIAVIASALLLPVVLQAADTTPDPKAAKSAAKTKAKTEAKCEYLTGSRIRHDPPVNCDNGAPGLRSFSAEDLGSTGEANIADALRKLDPRLR